MRREPSWRIPFGVLALLAGLGIYALVVASVLPARIGSWPTWAQVPVYLALGLAWLLPLKRFLVWMETGRWR